MSQDMKRLTGEPTVTGGTVPSSPQQNAIRAWQRLGQEMGRRLGDGRARPYPSAVLGGANPMDPSTPDTHQGGQHMSQDTTLRNAIALALYQVPQNGGGDAFARDADAILAMPEMQAIRSALASMAAVIHEHLGQWHDLTATDALVGHLGGEDDPDSVQHIVDWVTKEAST